MEFKIMLIVFAILLFLLTVLSAFGGSMKVGEPFTVGSNVKRTYTNSMEPSSMSMPPSQMPSSMSMPPSEMPSFNGGNPAGAPPLVFPPIVESYSGPGPQGGQVMQGSHGPQQVMQRPQMQAPQQVMQGSSAPSGGSGFTNIEPYEIDDGPKYASY
jgi:hypothetical protein